MGGNRSLFLSHFDVKYSFIPQIRIKQIKCNHKNNFCNQKEDSKHIKNYVLNWKLVSELLNDPLTSTKTHFFQCSVIIKHETSIFYNKGLPS